MRWRLKYSPAEVAYLEAKGAISASEKSDPDNALVWGAYLTMRGNVCMAEILAWLEITGIHDTPQRARIARLVMALERAENDGSN